MKKKLLALLTAVLMLTSLLAGCGGTPASGSSGSQSGEAAPVKQEVVFALQNLPDILDPNVTNNSFAAPFLDNLFEGLVAYDKDNNLVAGNAESWTISEDGLTYTFTLRDGLKWSDGSDLTAQDYLYTMKRILTPSTAALYVNMLTDYVAGAQEYYDALANGQEPDEEALGIKAPDDKTLVLTLKAPAPYYLGILAMYTFVPTQQAAVEAAPETWAQSAENYISNGPFKMTQYNFNESIVLEKNPNYWNAENVKLEKLTFRFILEPSTALSAFEAGEIDGFRTIPPADLPRLKAESDALQVAPSFATTYYMFNCQNEVLKDVRVRQALSLAVDRTALIENVLQTTDTPAYALVSPGYSVDGVDYTEGRSTYGLSPTADVEAAQKLLAEAGYPNGEGFPKLRLSYYTDANVKKIAEALQEMWKTNLGIDTEITVADWAVYYDSVQAGDYDICAMGWSADYLHPTTFFPLFVTGNVNNNSFYSNPEYDALYAQAAVMTDAQAAMEVMHQAEDMLMADMPFLPLYYRATTYMLRPGVKDVNMSPLAQLYFKDAYVAE